MPYIDAFSPIFPLLAKKITFGVLSHIDNKKTSGEDFNLTTMARVF